MHYIVDYCSQFVLLLFLLLYIYIKIVDDKGISVIYCCISF